MKQRPKEGKYDQRYHLLPRVAIASTGSWIAASLTRVRDVGTWDVGADCETLPSVPLAIDAMTIILGSTVAVVVVVDRRSLRSHSKTERC